MAIIRKQPSAFKLAHLPEWGTYRGKRVRISEVESTIPIIDREEVESAMTTEMCKAAGVSEDEPGKGRLVMPWRHSPILTIDEDTGAIDVGPDGVGTVDYVNPDTLLPFSYASAKARGDCGGLSDEQLEEMARTVLKRSVALASLEDTPRTRKLRGIIHDEILAHAYGANHA